MEFERFSGFYHERLAKGWERWVTVAIVALLLAPIPFVRFETWPSGNLLRQHPLTPWSRFRICYLSFPDHSLVDDPRGFHWNGLGLQPEPIFDRPLALSAAGEILFKWRDQPELPLTELDARGDLLLVRTGWQPLLLWPLRMLKEAWRQDLGIPTGKRTR